ncbi:Ribokinase-like protein [Ganoderma leucocontextum]|nr:Ribokinase-like protein [Ganoderma leucocontextum]
MATGNHSSGRILSIQSHVAYGYVGGKAAVFPLQCLGYDVDVVNTVNFSNHSGYGRFGGSKASAEELSRIFEIMEQNELLIPERLLTGYIPGAEATIAVVALAEKLRQRRPELIYLLDPVLGDSGRLYVSPEVVPIYRSALRLATIITPNWFEVEVLTDTQINNAASLRQAIRTLHQTYHVPHIVISSIPLKAWLLDILPAHVRPTSTDTSEFLACIASSQQASNTAVYASCFPCLSGYFSGVGDLFSALVLAHFDDTQSTAPGETPLSRAVSQAVSKTHAMLVLTHEAAATLPEDERTATDEEQDTREPMRKIRRMRGRELRLIQGQDIIRGVQPVEYRRLQSWDGFWGA